MSTPAMATAAAGTGHRITADEYEAMIRDGVLTENDKVELIDGQLEEIVPQGEMATCGRCDELDEQLECHVRRHLAQLARSTPHGSRTTTSPSPTSPSPRGRGGA